MGNETNDIIEKRFKSILQKYQEGLEESVKRSEFVFDSVDLFYCIITCKKQVWAKKGKSYIDSPKSRKNKKSTINPKNNDDNCFQYAIIAALNYQNIEIHPERISNLKPFIDQYHRKEINFSPRQKDWKKFELNNKTIALNFLFVPHTTEELRLAC